MVQLICTVITVLFNLYYRDEYSSLFTLNLTLQVTLHVINNITSGIPSIKEILSNVDAKDKHSLESSPGDTRLWNEVLHNIFKDLTRRDTLVFTDRFTTDRSDTTRSFVAFTCGHTFSENDFQRRILSEFREKLEDLPHPLVQTTTFLLQYFRHSTKFSSACPYCVFQNLRQTQLQYSPGVPIRPWNP